MLDEKAAHKFKILVLVDINGTLLLRTTAAGAVNCRDAHGDNFFIPENITGVSKKNKNLYKFFFRPGTCEFLRRMNQHPRI